MGGGAEETVRPGASVDRAMVGATHAPAEAAVGAEEAEGPAPAATGAWPLPRPYDFLETTRMLRVGAWDPTVRREPGGLWRTANTPEGVATVRLRVGDQVCAQAWGPGAAYAIGEVPAWIGLDDPVWALPPHPVTDRLLRRHRGLRATDTRDVFQALVTIVLQQLVTWQEAALTWRRLCSALGAPAPGPIGDLRLAPTPGAIRAAGPEGLQQLGVGFQRARTLLAVARAARLLEQTKSLPTGEASALLQSVRGVGPWTAAVVLGARLGRPEPVPVGDLHLPHTVSWALAGEPRGSDARMLELLEPFQGLGYRVVRLIHAARIEAPRRGPRMPLRRR